MIKTSGTIVIHSLLPAIFLVGYTYFTIFVDGNYESTTEFFGNWPIVKVAFTLRDTIQRNYEKHDVNLVQKMI